MSSHPSGLTVDIPAISGRIREIYDLTLGYITASEHDPRIAFCFLNRLASLYIYYSQTVPDFNDLLIFTNANHYFKLILSAVLFNPALDMRVPATPILDDLCPGTLVLPFGTATLESVDSIMTRVKPVADAIQRQMKINSDSGVVSPMPEITQDVVNKAISNVKKLLGENDDLEAKCASRPRTITPRPRPNGPAGGAGFSGFYGGRKHRRTHKKRHTKRRKTTHKRRN